MRVLVGLASIAATISIAPGVYADAYAFGGVSGRVRVEVTLLGFQEGAGVGGWDVVNARALARFARRVDRLLPKGAAVSIERDVDDDATTLILALPTRTERFLLDGAPGYDEAASVLARALGAPERRSAPTPPLFTVQVLASSDEGRASSFARALDGRGITAETSFFFEACRPCSVPEAHVTERGSDGLFRVVIGIFDRRESAGDLARELARRHALPGFARAL